jgi:hypothetical protein
MACRRFGTHHARKSRGGPWCTERHIHCGGTVPRLAPCSRIPPSVPVRGQGTIEPQLVDAHRTNVHPFPRAARRRSAYGSA